MRAIGIDLAEIRRRADARFGAGALDPPAEPAKRSLFGRRRRGAGGPTGHIRFTPEAKHALERALAEAMARRDRRIDVAHILLGTLGPDANTAVGTLRHIGVEPGTVRMALLADLDTAA